MILAVPVGMVIINMCQAGAFDYIFDDVKILTRGILGLAAGAADRKRAACESRTRDRERAACESRTADKKGRID